MELCLYFRGEKSADYHLKLVSRVILTFQYYQGEISTLIHEDLNELHDFCELRTQNYYI